jgi:hypothetical protein
VPSNDAEQRIRKGEVSNQTIPDETPSDDS